MISKWWWHIIDQYAVPADLNYLDNCAGIKLVGDYNSYKRLQALSQRYPGKPLAMRFINREGNGCPPTAVEAINFIEWFADTYNLRHVYYQTFHNMPAMDDHIAEWDATMVVMARAKGLHLITGDFSMGYPGVGRFATIDNPDRWNSYYPALRELSLSGGASWLGLQLYVGYGALEMGEAWLSLPLRYRELARVHLIPNGWSNIKIFGTEEGFDDPPWEGHVDLERAATALIALDKERANDGIYIGGALFTLDQSKWATDNGFNMRGGVFRLISSYQSAVNKPVDIPAPTRAYRVVAPYGMNLRGDASLNNPPVGWLPKGFPFLGRLFNEKWVIIDGSPKFYLARKDAGIILLEEID